MDLIVLIAMPFNKGVLNTAARLYRNSLTDIPAIIIPKKELFKITAIWKLDTNTSNRWILVQ